MNLFTTEDTALFDTRYVTVRGFKLFERRSKTNHQQTVLLIHGLNVSEKYYRLFSRELQKTHNVISIDLPGFGTSKNNRQALTFEGLAKIINDYINGYVGSSVVLIGQSMGTQVCAEVAARYPDCVERLVLIAPTVNNRERTTLWQAFRLFQDSFLEPFAVNAIIMTDFFNFGIVKLWRTQRRMMQNKLEETMTKVHTKTLLIAGEKDPISPPDWTHWVAKYASDARVEIISNAPHNPQFTHPKELHRLCISFLK
jgi:pimeloyl-ACP methyl ester carboxylesterase